MNAPELVARLQELVDSDDERAVVVDTGDLGGFAIYELVEVVRYDDAIVLNVTPRSA